MLLLLLLLLIQPVFSVALPTVDSSSVSISGIVECCCECFDILLLLTGSQQLVSG